KGGPDLSFNGGGFDAYVARINASGTGLDYAGYIGGTGDDDGNGIALDANGNTYVVGNTDSTQPSFPAVRGPDLTANGGTDAFAAKVNPSGSALVYCGYIGGASTDYGFGIAVDAGGYAYITGLTGSTQASFPVVVGPDLTFNSQGNMPDA